VDVALSGDFVSEQAGDGGIRGRFNRADEGADVGKANGDGRMADAGDLWVSQLHEQLLCSLEVSDGAEVGVQPP
jgi:hypothetical protein